jgi:hypothetical protein
MAFSFQKITQAICKQLEVIIMEEDDNVGQHINANDFMNEFYADEYLTKNRRVRPHSSNRNEQDEKHLSEGPSRIGDFGSAAFEDDTTFNKNTMFELQNGRIEVIKRKEKYEQEKREEAERKRKRDR